MATGNIKATIIFAATVSILIAALTAETIERCFGTAKEHHGMRYTQQTGNEKMRMKVGMTFACMNMKKLAKILWNRDHLNLSTNLFKLFTKSKCIYV